MICGAQKRGSMPNQGPRSECNHCNNNMLATHKHNASALFWYTQRYHAPTRGYLAQSSQTKGPGAWTGDPGSRAPRHGYRPFSVSLVNLLEGNFVQLCISILASISSSTVPLISLSGVNY